MDNMSLDNSGMNNPAVWQHDIYRHCYEQLVFVLSSRGLLALICALYIGHINPNLKRSNAVHVRFAIAVLSTCVHVLDILLRKSQPAPVDCLVDGLASLTWLLLALYLWKLRNPGIQLVKAQQAVIAVWAFTLVALCSRVLTLIKQWQSHDETLSAGEKGTVGAWALLQGFYLLSLFPAPRNSTFYNEFSGTSASDNVKDITGEEPLSSSASLKSDTIELGIAESNASFLSKVTFRWIEPLMRKGAKGQIGKAADVFHLPKKLTTHLVESYFASVYPQGSAAFAEEVFASEESDHKVQSLKNPDTPVTNTYGSTQAHSEEDSVPELTIGNGHKDKLSLVWALFKAFGVQFVLLGFFFVLSNILTFSGPLVLNSIVSFMEDQTEPMRYGFYYAMAMFLSTFCEAVLDTSVGHQRTRFGMKVRAALITSVYRKSLAVSSTTLSAFTTGQILNFMSTDTNRVICGFCFCLHELWSLPIKVVVALYLLYRQVGVSFLGGLAVFLVLTPVTKCVMQQVKKIDKDLMKHRDDRVKKMSEILNGIRVIKYYAWERHFSGLIEGLRSKELRCLRSIKYLRAACHFLWTTTPVFLSLVTFTSCSLLGNQLTAAQVFTSIALFSILIHPLNAIPWVVNAVIEAWVSIKRIQKFMDLEEADLEKYYQPDDKLSEGKKLNFHQAYFHWDHPKKDEGTEDEDVKDDEDKGKSVDEGESKEGVRQEAVKLQNINLNVYKGQLVGVIGKVGSGKSSLFSAILAEMGKEKGDVTVAGLGQGFGLATQEPWLQHATVKENILFGKAYNAEWYQRVVEACALVEDLKMLPAGDDTEIGEKGITLSGGQKARVALARAVYQDCEIYLLDDPLAAVDAHVGHHIFSKCIMGLLRHKTRILCTHHTHFLTEADTVVVMDDFRIADIGAPREVLKDSDFTTHQKLIDSKNKSEVSESGSEVKVPNSNKKLIEEEEKESGAVKLGVYKSYLNAIGTTLASCVVLSFVFRQATTNLSDWWLSHWVKQIRVGSFDNLTSTTLPTPQTSVTEPSISHSGLESIHSLNTTTPSSVVFYLGIYGGLTGASAVFTLLRAFLVACGSMHAATIIHERLLKSILKAPLSFFNTTPLGRIINRFSSDVATIDGHLPSMLSNLAGQAFCFLGTLALTCYGLPWFALFLLPMGLVFYYIQDYYRKTSREVRRIGSIAYSAIHSHFSETIAGAPVIKALRATQRFREENRSKLELSQRVWFNSCAANCWLSFRLQMMGVAMVTAVTIIAVVERQFQTVDPGLIGLVISYALSITHLLIVSVHTVTEMEKSMISAERTQQYTVAIPAEPQEGLVKAPPLWPHRGVVNFHNVQFSYREGNRKALDGVNFETLPGERVGIVGRTGSGKSTLFLVLFRMVEIQLGEVSIDGMNLAELSLQEVRSRLAIIPQDPFLFSGTVRENLDPVGEFSKSELWCVLEKCYLKEVVTRMGGLEALAGEGGKQFSTGQKQLVCLARAMLTKAKVLCIDEATASVDMETDDLLQKAIREEFRDNTILTIAHRINTISDSDRILVMDAGKVSQFDKPTLTTANM